MSAGARALRCRGVRGTLAGVAVGLIVAGTQDVLPSASAQDGVGFERRPYVGIGAGVTRLEPESPSGSLSVADDSSVGLHVYAGYDLARWLSVELYFADLGEAGIDFLGTDVGDIGYSVYGVNAVAYVLGGGGLGPFADAGSGVATRRGPSLFLTAGVGGLANDSALDYRRDHAAHVTFGAGLEYGFDNGVALRAELQSYDVDAQHASLSVLKRFGGPRARTVSPASSVPASGRGAEPAPVPAATAKAPVRVPEPAARPASVAPLPEGPTMFRPIVPPYLYFDFDRETLTSDTVAKLDAFIDVVRDTDFTLELGGHTDGVGPQGYNLRLSERRARSVRDHLISRGVDASRLRTDGYGETRPMSSNATARGRAENRRAEIVLTR